MKNLWDRAGVIFGGIGVADSLHSHSSTLHKQELINSLKNGSKNIIDARRTVDEKTLYETFSGKALEEQSSILSSLKENNQYAIWILYKQEIGEPIDVTFDTAVVPQVLTWSATIYSKVTQECQEQFWRYDSPQTVNLMRQEGTLSWKIYDISFKECNPLPKACNSQNWLLRLTHVLNNRKSMKFAYTILYVSDVARSIAFYETAFSLKRRFIHESGQYAELETGGTTLSFAANDLAHSNLPEGFQENSLANPPAGIEVGFVAADVTAAFAQAVEAGAVAVAAPKMKPWGQTVAYVRDLDGVLVELCSAM